MGSIKKMDNRIFKICALKKQPLKSLSIALLV